MTAMLAMGRPMNGASRRHDAAVRELLREDSTFAGECLAASLVVQRTCDNAHVFSSISDCNRLSVAVDPGKLA